MVAFIVFVIILIGIGAVVVPVIYMQMRVRAREQKNYERGLKMVPLLIHLPPQSDDTEVGARDVRDVTDETISKAQIIYNIIASTLQKGFKARFYGQRHFSFEIVGTHGFVYFYAIAPVALVDVVKQAVVSAYPASRLEEVTEHNIFSPVGKVSGTAGGELNLKEGFAYPIATYQDMKRDAMQSVLNSLSTLDKEDGAGIQILLRPADPIWRKTASTLASKKRKGEDEKSSNWSYARELLFALWRPPEGKKEEGNSPKPLSELEQATLNAIDEKTRHPGYEVQIRIIASSNIAQRSQSIVSNIVASFSLFDAPSKNGFKYSPAKDMESFVTSYLMRFFQPAPKPNILNSVELATLFHFPDQKNIPTSQVTRQESKQVDGPRNVPESGLLLGYNVFRGVKKPIRLDLLDRQRHMYVVGQTGVGKSVFLENLAFQDMLAGNGFAFVDPHGDTAEKLLSMIPRERTEDLIYFSPADMDFPMGLNLFEFNSPDQKDFLIQEALNMLYKLYDPQHQGIMGPRYEHLFRNAALTVMADPEGGTFVDIPKLFRDPKFVQQKLKYVTDQNVVEFWQKEMPQSQRSNEFGEVVSWFVSKFGAFLSNEMMRNIIGQNKSAFDLRDVMDNKKILLVNLSKGRLGDLNAKLLGMIFVMKFQAAAMSRANIPEIQRVDFSLYVDEFQNFSTDSFATIMSEARKYHLNLIVANQFTTQLTPEIRDAVFGNMGTIVSFRIGQNDIEAIAKYFQPTFDADDLLRVPNYNTVTRTLIGGVPTQPFSMATLPPLGSPNPKLADALKQLSAAKFGRARAGVEKEIFARLATKPDPLPARPSYGTAGPAFSPPAPGGSFGTPSTGPTAGMAGPTAAARPGFGAPSPAGPPLATVGSPQDYGPVSSNPWQSPPSTAPAGLATQASPTTLAGPSMGTAGPATPTPTGTGSFLDEWLSKRQTQPSVVNRSAPPPAGPAATETIQIPSAPPVAPSTSAGDSAGPSVPVDGRADSQTKVQSQSVINDEALKPIEVTETDDSASGEPQPTSADDILKPSEKSLEQASKASDSSTAMAGSDQQTSEVTKIAEELQDSLRDSSGGEAGVDKSAEDIASAEPPKKNKKDDQPGGDSIFIDPDGTLHINNDDEA